MSEMRSILPENIILSIQENNGQITIGNYVVQMGSVHGSVINIALPEQKPEIRPLLRAEPNFLPPPPMLLLDRLAETETVLEYLYRRESVEIYGLSGIGKTTLLAYLAHQPLAHLFPNGAVYLSGRRKFKDDLLQELFELFHEFEPQNNLILKPSQIQIQRGLRHKKALIILDNASLSRDELQQLQLVLPHCTLLLASTERHWWRQSEGKALLLPGLPLENSLELLEHELGRTLNSEEQLAARVLCAALAGHPDHLIQAAALVRETPHTLVEVAYQSQQAYPDRAVASLILTTLTEAEKQLLQFLAALEGAAVPVEHLQGLTGRPDSGLLLDKLQRRGLVRVRGDRYGLPDNLNQLLLQNSELAVPAARALAYFTHWTEERATSPARLLEEREIILQLLAWAQRGGHWSEALRLVRAVEAALALSKRWALWEQVLQIGLQAAQAINNRAAKAWALHQLGSRALCLGETRLARAWLSQALELREALGDTIGATLTRHNLELLPPPPASGPDSPPEVSSTPSTEITRRRELEVFSVLVGLMVMVPLFLVAWLSFSGFFTPDPTPAMVVAFATITPIAVEPLAGSSPTPAPFLTTTPSPLPPAETSAPISTPISLPAVPLRRLEAALPPSPTLPVSPTSTATPLPALPPSLLTATLAPPPVTPGATASLTWQVSTPALLTPPQIADTNSTSEKECVEFETLSPGIYQIDESLSEAGIVMTIEPLVSAEGELADQGLAEVELYGTGPGPEQRLQLRAAGVVFQFNPPPQGLSLVFDHLEGYLSLEINRESHVFSDFTQIDGATVGQVTVTVHQDSSSYGQLHFRGTIESFRIGGQGLWLDHICPE